MNIIRLRMCIFVLSCSCILGACAPATTSSPDLTAVAATPVDAVDPFSVATTTSSRSHAQTIVTPGSVVPFTSLSLHFPYNTGIVSEVLVEAGQKVRKGELLAHLDSRQLEIDRQKMQLKLEQMRLQIEDMKDGPIAEEVALSQARLESARADLGRAQTSVNEQDVEAARSSNIAYAQSLDELRAGPLAEDIAGAQAELDRAVALLQQTRDQFAATKIELELQVEQRANVVRNKQDEYSHIYWRNRESEWGRELSQEELDQEAETKRAVENEQAALEIAQVKLEEARKSEQTRIAQIETEVRIAQADLTKLLNGSEQSDMTASEANVARSAAELERLSGPNRAATIASARSRVAEAEATLALLLAAPTANAVAQAANSLRLAELEVEQARLNVENAALYAPIDGTVVIVKMYIGAPAQESYIELADYSNWRIESETLNELDVVRIREGSTARVSFVALPETEITGRVEKIRLVPQANGSLAYQAVIIPDSWDSRLRWNMSASITINAQDN